MAMKRLPVLQPKASEDAAAEQRPRWQWIAIGALLGFTLWMPLLMVALAVRARAIGAFVDTTSPEAFAATSSALSGGQLAMLYAGSTVPVLLSLAIACGVAAGVVGRFGGRTAPSDALWSGVAVALVAWLLAAGLGPPLPPTIAAGALVLLLGAGAGSAKAGGAWGARRRPSE